MASFTTPPSLQPPSPPDNSPPSNHGNVVNSKIMVVAVAVLFAVVLFILCLHIYAKWFWRNQAILQASGGLQGASWSRRRRRRGDPEAQNLNAGIVSLQAVGLDRALVEALPSFEYSAKEMKHGLECAVCLEEFDEGEKGRTLPKCSHNFHLDCIDMWLHSHSTCPLCRASLVPDEDGKESEKAAQQFEATVVAINHQPQVEPVIGDVQAPFMAVMRASRRRLRGLGLGPSLNNSTGSNPNSLQRTVENQEGQSIDIEAIGSAPDADLPQREPQTTQEIPNSAAAVDKKDLLKNYETPVEIPSNVLFWGNQTHMSTTGLQSTAESVSPGIYVPFQVAIEIPRSGEGTAGDAANGLSPIARASASFRRLLSRGKGVVSPQTSQDEGVEAGLSPRNLATLPSD